MKGRTDLKLNPAKVRAIRGELAKGRTQTDIGREFGVAQTAVSAVARGERWAHVKGVSNA